MSTVHASCLSGWALLSTLLSPSQIYETINRYLSFYFSTKRVYLNKCSFNHFLTFSPMFSVQNDNVIEIKLIRTIMCLKIKNKVVSNSLLMNDYNVRTINLQMSLQLADFILSNFLQNFKSFNYQGSCTYLFYLIEQFIFSQCFSKRY